MSFETMLVHTAQISRRAVGQGVKSNYAVIEASARCLIQPVTAQYAAESGFVYGRTFNGYFNTTTDIKMNDRVVDQDGVQYSVAGLLNRNYGGTPHVTATLIQLAGT